jgi:hypothetical protein
VALAIAIAGASTSSVALADADADLARAAMRRGQTAVDAGDPSRALDEYELAKRLVPAANAPWFFAGQALEQLWRWREAVASFEGYLAKDPSVSDAGEVRARIQRIRAEHFPARAIVVVDAPGAEVSVDHGPAAPTGALELTPGRHNIEARAPGFERAGVDLDLVGDTTSTVTLVLSPTPPASSVTPSRVPTSPSSVASPGVPWRTVGWAAAGVGLAGFLSTFIVDALVLGPKLDDYRQAATLQDAKAGAEARDSAEPLRTALLVGYVVSGAVTAAGVTVGLLAPARRVGIAPMAGPRAAGVSAAYVF